MEEVNCNFDQKNIKFFSAVNFFSNFWSSKPVTQIGIQPEMLDLDPDLESLNMDPKKHCNFVTSSRDDTVLLIIIPDP
jgi:hypothetical protein